MQNALDEEVRADDNDEAEDEDEADDEWKELFSKPVAEKVVSPPGAQVQPQIQINGTDITKSTAPTATTTTTSAPTSTPTPSKPTSTLRNRHAATSTPTRTESSAKTTGSSISPDDPKIAAEKALDDDRTEQEDLTSSLVSMASQLKSQSQSFQETLDNEKDALDRAALGMDKTSSTMEAAGKRMGMLRRMTEGKGWWGRMMLYAWIFGLWIIAILIVFVGPKLRF